MSLFKQVCLYSAIVLNIIQQAVATPPCGIHRPFWTTGNKIGRLDRRGALSTNPGNPGIAVDLPFSTPCYTLGFYFKVQADGLIIGTEYHMAYFDTPDPWRIKLVKTGPLQYRIETVI